MSVNAPYYIIYQLFSVETMCFMSASDDSLFIFFYSILPIHLIPPIPSALNAASLDRLAALLRREESTLL